MKKIKMWIVKINTIWFFFVGLIVTAIVLLINMEGEIDKLCVTTLFVPLMFYFFQIALQKRMNNDYCDIDLKMSKTVEQEIVWRVPRKKYDEGEGFLLVKNTGKVDIFSLYIKVTTKDSEVRWYMINEGLSIDDTHAINVPYEIGDITEVTISSWVSMESRTKKFYGTQSGNDDFSIFSRSEKFDSEKKSICHEQGFDIFEQLERFVI